MRARALIAALAVVLGAATTTVAEAAWTNAGATTHATFAAAAEFPPVLNLVPAVLGTPQVGVAVHANAGAFSPAPTASTITWLRCDATGAACVSTGSTGADYTVAVADIAKTLRAQIATVNGSTAGATAVSEPTAAVLAINLGPTLKTPVLSNTPSIAGTAQVGAPLLVSTGTWQQVGVTMSYKWERCDATGAGCAAITGATAASYTPVAADSGHRLVVSVTAALLGLIPNTTVTDATNVVA